MCHKYGCTEVRHIDILLSLASVLSLIISSRLTKFIIVWGRNNRELVEIDTEVVILPFFEMLPNSGMQIC